MTVRIVVAWVIGGLLLVGPTLAQDSTLVLDDVGLRRDTIDTFQPQPYSLAPFIVPGTETIWVGPTQLDTSEYRLDTRNGKLWVSRSDLIGARDTLFAQYRTFPFGFEEVYRRRAPDTAAADTGAVAIVEDTSRDRSGFRPFEGVDIQRSGSISRGVVGGSNRDVNVESGLRMELDGEVAEDVHVRALLTDENTPIQPGGSTQRLRDFDRVFLGITAPQGRARLGDVDVRLGQGTFGTFDQKVQGMALSSTGAGERVGLTSGDATLVGAVSRGQYRTQDIEAIDGVQGPYRLRGEDGDDRIIIIAGSERVYLDGQRLTRGRSNGYVIDYSRAEITFTSKHIITEDRRITVEFQYSTTQFTRTLVGGQTEAGAWAGDDGKPRLKVGASVLRKADGRDFQTAFDLSSEDSLRLANAGDGQAVRSGAKQVQFDAEAPFVQYRREVVSRPTGGQDTIFVALDEAPPEGTPVFRVRFTRVGPGEGSYERVGRDVNGVLYEYRGPGQGAYAPIQPLPAPTKQRLVDLTGSVEPVPGVELFGEWAQSVNDENRFSSLDSGDDRDQAYVGGVRIPGIPLDLGVGPELTVSGKLRRESRGRFFETFNQSRPIEYGRRWNLSQSGSGLPATLRGEGAETVDQAEVQLSSEEGSSIEAAGGRLAIGSVFEAWRHQEALSLRQGSWPRVSVESEYVTSTNRLGDRSGNWLRQKATLRQPLFDDRFEPRVEVERERRRQRVQQTDSLTRDAFSFLEVRPGIAFRGETVDASGSVEYRTEDQAAEGTFRDASHSWTVQSEATYDPTAPYNATLRGGYRVRRVTDYFRINRQRRDTESLLLRLDGRMQPLDRAIDVKAFYDAVTKRTPVLQETYIRTGPNLGQYVWRDANDDGIQQIDEFVPETTPNEGAYVQRFVPSDSLESVVDLQARTRILLDPGEFWSRPDAWWKKGLSAVETETTMEVQEKSRTDAVARIYGLYLRRFRQRGTTLNGQVRVEQRVELFPQRRAFGLTGDWSHVRGLTERAAGVQTSYTNVWEVATRIQPTASWAVKISGKHGVDRTRSEAFASSRSFNIRTIQGRPSITYQIGPTLTTTVAGVYAEKKDRLQGRRARLLRLPTKLEWARAGRLRLTANAEIARVDLTGAAVGRARFQLTDGRGPGTSMIWGLQGRYVITNNLEASVSYDGRAPSGAPVIHTVRAKVSATF